MLIDSRGGLIYDSDFNNTCYAVENANPMNWWGANNWAASQTYGILPAGAFQFHQTSTDLVHVVGVTALGVS